MSALPLTFKPSRNTISTPTFVGFCADIEPSICPDNLKLGGLVCLDALTPLAPALPAAFFVAYSDVYPLNLYRFPVSLVPNPLSESLTILVAALPPIFAHNELGNFKISSAFILSSNRAGN